MRLYPVHHQPPLVVEARVQIPGSNILVYKGGRDGFSVSTTIWDERMEEEERMEGQGNEKMERQWTPDG
jgi:hypothetical protein